jgi:hypothetical protein
MNASDFDFTGEIRYSSAFEAEVSAEPWFALCYEDGSPADVALEARIIAGHWHAGQSSALYAFHSSGHLDADRCIYELSTLAPTGKRPDTVSALLAFFDALRPEDTSETPCTDHGLDTCPDCGNAGAAIGPNGYYECTRFLTCWTDTTDDMQEGIS